MTQATRWLLLMGAATGLGATLPSQSGLDAAAAQFQRAWSARDADAIASALAPEGIRLQLAGERHPLLSGRQARAAIAEFLASRAGGRVEAREVRELGGEPPRGSAEFRWQTVVQGTSEPVTHTIFVEFVRGGSGWRITQIRVF